jgi:toxin CcdB
MAQLDVHRSLITPPAEEVLYLLDVQSDLLEVFNVRVVVPLFRATGFARPIRRLNPGFRIEGVAVIMATQFIAGTSVRNLGEVVATLADQRDDVIGAIDMLITGI